LSLKFRKEIINWAVWGLFLCTVFCFLFEITGRVIGSLLNDGNFDVWKNIQLLATTFSLDFLQKNGWDFEGSVLYYWIFWEDIRLLLVESFLFIITLSFLVYAAQDRRKLNFLVPLVIIFCLFSLLISYISPFVQSGAAFNGFFQVTLGSTVAKLVVILFSVCLLISIWGWIGVYESLKVEVIFLLGSILWALSTLLVSNDLFIIYLLLETLSFLICLLLVVWSKKQVRVEASVKYFILNGVASILFCLGGVLVYLSYGSTFIENVGGVHLIGDDGSGLSVLFILLISLSLLGKLGTAPFSLWLVDIYSISSFIILGFLLIPLKLSVFFIFIKIFYSGLIGYFNFWQVLLLISGVISLVYGCLGALRQFNIKRFIAWTTVNQAGYLLIGFVFGVEEGLSVLLNYLFIYSLSSLALILCLMGVSRKLGYEVIYFSDLSKVFNQERWIAFFIGVLMFSFAGLPPLAGFYAKYLLLLEVANQTWYNLLIILLIISLISAFYYIRFIRLCFINKDGSLRKKEQKITVDSLLIWILIAIIVGFYLVQSDILQICLCLAKDLIIYTYL